MAFHFDTPLVYLRTPPHYPTNNASSSIYLRLTYDGVSHAKRRYPDYTAAKATEKDLKKSLKGRNQFRWSSGGFDGRFWTDDPRLSRVAAKIGRRVRRGVLIFGCASSTTI